MTANPPENADPPQDGPDSPPSPGYAAPPPPPGYAAPPPPAPGYAAPPPPAGYAAPPPAYGAPQGAYPPPAYGVAPPLSQSDQQLWSVLSHIGGVFVSFVVPLVVWLVFKGRGAFVEDQAKEALNFQITLLIAYIAGGVLSIIGVGLIILFAAWVLSIVFAIMAAVKSSQGELYRYPISIRMIT